MHIDRTATYPSSLPSPAEIPTPGSSRRRGKRLRAAVSGAVCSAALAVAACSEPLVDGTYAGEALFQFSGAITSVDNAVTLNRSLEIAVVWLGTGTEDDVYPAAVTQIELSSRYTVTLRERPDASAVRPIGDGLVGSGEMALARISIFDDIDGDRQWNPSAGEPMVGGNSQLLLLFTPTGITGTAELTPGYHIVFDPSGKCLDVSDPSFLPEWVDHFDSTAVDLLIQDEYYAATDSLNCGSGMSDDPCADYLAEAEFASSPEEAMYALQMYELCQQCWQLLEQADQAPDQQTYE
ncbi:MAG: hypothetical protein AAGC55_20025, partial [Myxococcota bacterium]